MYLGEKMASFDEAFEITMGHEGGYSNLKIDRGGETFRGISRRFFPSWAGWRIVDKLKEDHQKLATDNELKVLVLDFYKAEFWDRFVGDEIGDQDIANELFDTSVNLGVHKAVKILQYSLNKLNRNQTVFPNMSEDGIYGEKTARALGFISRTIRDIGVLYKIMNVEQGHYYNEIMTASENQETFARGWYARVTFRKTRAF